MNTMEIEIIPWLRRAPDDDFIVQGICFGVQNMYAETEEEVMAHAEAFWASWGCDSVVIKTPMGTSVCKSAGDVYDAISYMIDIY